MKNYNAKVPRGTMRSVLQGEECKDNRNCIGFGAKSWDWMASQGPESCCSETFNEGANAQQLSWSAFVAIVEKVAS